MYSGVLIEFLNIGGGEMVLIIVVILLLFGGKKLPELARGLGKGIREFKDASDSVKREIHRNINNLELEKELEEQDAREKELEAARAAENHAQRHHPSQEEDRVSDVEVDEPIATSDQTESQKISLKKDKETEL